MNTPLDKILYKKTREEDEYSYVKKFTFDSIHSFCRGFWDVFLDCTNGQVANGVYSQVERHKALESIQIEFLRNIFRRGDGYRQALGGIRNSSPKDSPPSSNIHSVTDGRKLKTVSEATIASTHIVFTEAVELSDSEWKQTMTTNTTYYDSVKSFFTQNPMALDGLMGGTGERHGENIAKATDIYTSFFMVTESQIANNKRRCTRTKKAQLNNNEVWANGLERQKVNILKGKSLFRMNEMTLMADTFLFIGLEANNKGYSSFRNYQISCVKSARKLSKVNELEEGREWTISGLATKLLMVENGYYANQNDAWIFNYIIQSIARHLYDNKIHVEMSDNPFKSHAELYDICKRQSKKYRNRKTPVKPRAGDPYKR